LGLSNFYHSGYNTPPGITAHPGDAGINLNVVATAVKDRLQRPDAFHLSQNYPNPFNPTTIITYQIPSVSRVVLKVYNVLREEVVTLVNETESPGKYNVKFDGNNLPSGVYFYHITTGGFTDIRKLMLLR